MGIRMQAVVADRAAVDEAYDLVRRRSSRFRPAQGLRAKLSHNVLLNMCFSMVCPLE